MGKKLKLMVLCSVVLFMTSIAGADTYTMVFNTSDNPFDPGVDNQGWWSGTTAITDILSDNYSTGVSINGDHRSFFSFDLSTLSQPAISASLELQRYDYLSSAEFEELGLFDVSTNTEILNDNSYISEIIYDDLGNGNSYGEFNVLCSGNASDTLCFELNSMAIEDINDAAGGWFSIGGSLLSIDGTTIGSGAEGIFGGSSGAGIQRLVVEVIPEPISLFLLSSGFFVLLKRRFKNG